MTPELKEQLIKRLQSFLWRLGSYTIIATLAFIADNIGLFGFNSTLTAIIALICGELTKFVNTYQPNK